MQAKLIFEAQMIERTTACCLSEGLERLQPTLQMDASRHIGKILTDSVEKRMDPNKLGAAKTVRAAVEQAHAVLLLAALGHPAADEYAMAYDLPIPEKAFQVIVLPLHTTPMPLCLLPLSLRSIGMQSFCCAYATPFVCT